MSIARVVHVTNVDIGLKIHLRNQLRYLRERGFAVEGVCSRGPLISQDGPTAEGLTVKLIDTTSSATTPWRDLRALARLARHFRAGRFDIVHTHSLKPGLLGRLAARMAGVPIVVHTIHGLFFYDGMPPPQRRFWAAVERMGMALGDYALSQNQRDVETAIAMGVCRPERIGYLGNGIDLEEFSPRAVDQAAVAALRAELGVGPGELVVAMAGRFLVEKGYLEFCAAAQQIRARRPDIHFWTIGPEQPGREGALSLAHPVIARAAPAVRFLGRRDDMPRVLAAADIFALPSYGREGVPRVLMEAAALERALVSTDVRGCSDVVRHGQTGLLVPPRDAAALAAAILRLADGPAERVRLGLAAGRFARARFDERDYFRKIAYTYEQLLARRLPRLSLA